MTIPIMLLAAAATAADPPICTDRPTKANSTCTVPAGKFQLETSAAGWSLTKGGGARTEVLTVGTTFAKLGLSDRSDLQLGLTSFARLTVTQGDESERVTGFGDVVIRYKYRLTSDNSKVQVGVIPFVKLPTAKRPFGNRKLEGGIALPVSFASGPVTMTLGPEGDLLADSDGNGHHPAIVSLVNIAGPIAPRLTLAGELWSNFNLDPDGTVKQASADAALSWLATDTLQLDAGGNVGLTRDTPDLELYVGAAVRF